MTRTFRRQRIRKTFLIILAAIILSGPLLQSCTQMIPDPPKQSAPDDSKNEEQDKPSTDKPSEEGGNPVPGKPSDSTPDGTPETPTNPTNPTNPENGTDTPQEPGGSGQEGSEGGESGGDEEDKKDPPASATPVTVLDEKMVFLEEGKRIEIEIPAGYTGYAVLMNDGSNWKDGGFTMASYTVEGPEDKALISIGGATFPEYKEIGEIRRLSWEGMPKNMGGSCNAYEVARDTDTGIIYMMDSSVPADKQEELCNLLDTLYYRCPEALPGNSLRNAESLAGRTPTTMFTESGKRYLFVLFTDFGEGMENTLGVFGTIGQIYGTYPSVDINSRAFINSVGNAWQLSTTMAHEYSHFLESYIRMMKTGRPGFGTHLLAEGYADWSAGTSTGRSRTSEANYIALWMEDGNLWHPTKENFTADEISMRIADYGLGSLLWERIAHENGSSGVQKVLGSASDDFSGLEAVVGRDFGTWFDRSVMDILMAMGADDGSGRDVSYLRNYQLKWILDCITKYIGEASVGKTSVKMTSTGVKIVILSDSTYAFSAEGADRCMLFALKKPEK